MDITNFAKRIKTERINKEMTQKKLAELIEVDNATLSRIESGKVEITVAKLLKIAEALNVTADYLLLDFSQDNYSESEYLWKHICKLGDKQKKLLIDMIMILTQNSERWKIKDTSAAGGNLVVHDDNKTVDYEEIGKRIRSFRLQARYSQEKLAELAGISTSFLGSIERGEEVLSIESLFKLANALEQPTSSLLLNANRDNSTLDFREAVEELAQADSYKITVLLNMLMVLVDNSDKW